MENSAAAAYEKIDKTVTENLKAAREILIRLALDEEEKSSSKSLTSARKTISISEFSAAPGQRAGPPVVVRCPNDSPMMKGRKPKISKINGIRKLDFPDAQLINTTKSFTNANDIINDDRRGLEPLCNMSNMETSNIRSDKPDSLFPTAKFCPRLLRKKDVPPNVLQSELVMCPSITTNNMSYETTHMTERFEPLDSLNNVKSEEKISRKPDDMFPKASYLSGEKDRGKKIVRISGSDESVSITKRSKNAKSTDTVSSDGSSLSETQLPMTFFSTDGTMRMLLTKVDKGKKVTAHITPLVKKQKITSDEEIFPLVPRQLVSDHKLDLACRSKFNAKFTIGKHSVDISGLFKNKKLELGNLEKLIVNGQSYKI